MKRRFLVLPICALAIALAGLPPLAISAEQQRISGPYTADNLSIYFVHGPSQPGPVPLTLGEALKRNLAAVYETGQVSRLAIENKSDREVFVQAGDIVKGGRQDRVLALSLVLPPRSGRIPIGAFCVEQGRWRKRGGESAARFHSAQELLPQKAAKLALATPGRRRPAQRQLRQPLNTSVPAVAQRQLPVRQRILQRQGGASQQQRVWASVRKMQSKLSRNLKTIVTSDISRSSLQLTLEHKKLAAARDGLIASLRDRIKGKDDVIGAVFAINGKINSGDVYPSHGLFLKMWPRLVSAAATEAIAEKPNKAAPKPAAMPVEKIAKFMQLAESGKTERKPLGAQLERETRVAKDKAIVMSTRRASGDFIHRSYVAY